MAEYKKKRLSEIDIYEKWDALGFMTGIKDEYIRFKLAYTYEMMAGYILSLPETDDAVAVSVESAIFPVIRKLIKGGLTIDVRNLHKLIIKMIKDKDGHIQTLGTSMDAEAEILNLVVDEIMIETYKGKKMEETNTEGIIKQAVKTEIKVKEGMEEIWDKFREVKSVAIRGQKYEVAAALRDFEKRFLVD